MTDEQAQVIIEKLAVVADLLAEIKELLDATVPQEWHVGSANMPIYESSPSEVIEQ